jgi:sigma-54 dependent transcriptional regulator, flagellar regulatory protein
MAASVTQPEVRSSNRPVYGEGSPLAAVERECLKIASSESTVLLHGETGTGKEIFARLVHNASARASGPFVPVNCAAIPDSLVESELFGYVKGAFTGAQNSRKGRVAHAHGGTLFLDEIGELPASTQVKLLRVLQEKRYEPVGSVESVEADFRLVVATNRDLAAEVEAGRFRRDLYYRLLVCPLSLPPLKDRACDVVPLFLHFWRQRGEGRSIEPEVLRSLEQHDWPGNVRELENLVERISVCADGTTIRTTDLPPHLQSKAGIVGLTDPAAQRRAMLRLVSEEAHDEAPARLEFPVDLPHLLRSLEEAYVDAALAHAGGSKKVAADLLGIHRTTLVEKLRRWGREPGKG